MTRKIIIYNSFARDAAHAMLLQRQLDDVKRDLLTCDSAERRHKLVNERELLQRHLRKLTRDSSGAFMGGELIAQESRYGRDERTTTLRPGYDTEPSKREKRLTKNDVVRQANKAKLEANAKLPKVYLTHQVMHGTKPKSKDGVGTPAEQAYGRGWHEYSTANPYDDPALAKEWTRGRQDAATARKMRGNSFRGGVRGQGFTQPKHKPGPVSKGHIADFQSERGFVAKFVDNKTGKTLARSEPMISEARAKAWIEANKKAVINKGYRNFGAAVEHTFYDPAKVADAGGMVMMSFNFTAKDKDGKKVRFNIKEPPGPNASRYAYERAEKIATQQGYTELKGG